MFAASGLIEDNSNSPSLFYDKQSSQTFESKTEKHNKKSQSSQNHSSKSEVSETKEKKSLKTPLNTKQNDSTPGPGAYYPENSMRAVYRTAPLYSLRSRLEYCTTDRSTDPCYHPQVTRFMNRLWGESPHHSFGHRHSWYKATHTVKYK